MTSAEISWRASDALHLHVWEDEAVAYHSLSGETHLLGAAAATLLQTLRQSPADAIALSQALAFQPDMETDAEFMQQVYEILRHLEQLKLIEQHSH